LHKQISLTGSQMRVQDNEAWWQKEHWGFVDSLLHLC
jgi:hypothetical protein